MIPYYIIEKKTLLFVLLLLEKFRNMFARDFSQRTESKEEAADLFMNILKLFMF